MLVDLVRHGHSVHDRSSANRGVVSWHSHDDGNLEHHHQFTTSPEYHPYQLPCGHVFGQENGDCCGA